MVWLCVALSVLLVLGSAGFVVLVRNSRRRFARLPGVFRCRLRLVGGLLPGVSHEWAVRLALASWAHDVLLVRSGWWPGRTHVLPVRGPIGSVAPASPYDVPGLGVDPVTLRLRLDDGDVVEVAASAAARERLVGPFVVACIAADGERTDRRPPGR